MKLDKYLTITIRARYKNNITKKTSFFEIFLLHFKAKVNLFLLRTFDKIMCSYRKTYIKKCGCYVKLPVSRQKITSFIPSALFKNDFYIILRWHF